MEKFFYSKGVVWVCIILFWIVYLQNWMVDHSDRLRVIFGNWFMFVVILMYFWGLAVGIVRWGNTGTGVLVYINLIPLVVLLVINYTLKNFPSY